MSGQGTGSAQILSYEEALLVAWGEWARAGLGLGFSSLKHVDKSGRFLFTESDILLADRLIAGLPPRHKKIIKRWYWFDIHEDSDAEVGAAVSEFKEALEEHAVAQA